MKEENIKKIFCFMSGGLFVSGLFLLYAGKTESQYYYIPAIIFLGVSYLSLRDGMKQ